MALLPTCTRLSVDIMDIWQACVCALGKMYVIKTLQDVVYPQICDGFASLQLWLTQDNFEHTVQYTVYCTLIGW